MELGVLGLDTLGGLFCKVLFMHSCLLEGLVGVCRQAYRHSPSVPFKWGGTVCRQATSLVTRIGHSISYELR
eukprot:scaffold226904_cov37-Prasinocladus_malaysianus.AAC.1